MERELNKWRKKLERYNQKPTDKLNQEIRSYICQKQLEIMENWKIEKPHTEDKHQSFRDLLDDMRRDLKLEIRTKHQYPPENIREISQQKREKAEEEAKKVEELLKKEEERDEQVELNTEQVH